MSVYTLAFREDAAGPVAYGSEERLNAAAELMTTIGAADGQAVVALPAGFVAAESADRRDAWADGLAAAARNAGVGIVFGVDVVDSSRAEGCLRSFAFASDRGRRLLWGAGPSGRGAALVDRTVRLGTARTTVLFGRELFAPQAAAVVATAQPDLVVILGHGGPTRKWLAPVAALDELAPALVVHQELTVRRPVELPPPRGWRVAEAGGAIRIVCYRREASTAASRIAER
jgi:hypothetical protein